MLVILNSKNTLYTTINFPQELVETRNSAKSGVNIGLTFVRWPGTQLQINNNVCFSICIHSRSKMRSEFMSDTFVGADLCVRLYCVNKGLYINLF